MVPDFHVWEKVGFLGFTVKWIQYFWVFDKMVDEVTFGFRIIINITMGFLFYFFFFGVYVPNST